MKLPVQDVKKLLPRLLLSMTVAVAMPSWAEDEEPPAEGEEAAATAVKPIYIPLKPPFVVNYGGVGRLKYIKTELSVRVKDPTSANALRHHMPLIRNSLVLLFSSQTDSDLDTQEGKELLRQTALNEINALLEAEEGESGVIDLYFNNLIVQQ